MIELCKKEKVPLPIFREQLKGLLVIFRFGKTYHQNTTLNHHTNNLTKRQLEILNIIKEYKEVNYYTLQEKLIHPPSKRTIQMDLNKLKEIGLIQLKGRAQSAKWIFIRQ